MNIAYGLTVNSSPLLTSHVAASPHETRNRKEAFAALRTTVRRSSFRCQLCGQTRGPSSGGTRESIGSRGVQPRKTDSPLLPESGISRPLHAMMKARGCPIGEGAFRPRPAPRESWAMELHLRDDWRIPVLGGDLRDHLPASPPRGEVGRARGQPTRLMCY